MIILVYSAYHAQNIQAHFGEADYSYYYVLKEYVPLLQKIGIVLTVHNPEKEVNAIYHNAKAHGQDCVFLSFTPPHKTCMSLACPTIPVFAWEFSSLPTENWLDETNSGTQHDWRQHLSLSKKAITHCDFSIDVVKQAMGADYPIVCAPAPVWDRCAALFARPAASAFTLSVAGSIVDSRQVDLTKFCPTSTAINPAQKLLRNSRVAQRHPAEITLDGVIYFASFNPQDGRKNWLDMIDGFVLAHKHHADATLVLKLIHHDVLTPVHEMLRILYAHAPFACRVVLIHGYLPDDSYQNLLQRAHFVVNTSHGEGQCLPLMELMSMGTPALAPRHTAMLDYVHSGNAFVIESQTEPTFWAHDSRKAYRTLRHRINAASVQQAFMDSYAVYHEQPERYQDMRVQARDTLQKYCSQDIVLERVSALLKGVSSPDTPNRTTLMDKARALFK